ncbi:MAG: hypothetical protein K0R08_1542 [Solimicrobium sp.]|jgi:hypothetical protein|nr:hypothetical protein [Solimicrobium sp.]
MNKDLSIDEFEALEYISLLSKNVRPNACVNRNVKRLCGIKLVSYRKDGQLELTESGKSALFAKQCIEGLRNLSHNSPTQLSVEVATFLSKKSYMESTSAGRRITQRGLDCLADIDAQKKN